MFGLVIASLEELSEEQKNRYQAVYCGICRSIRDTDGQLCRVLAISIKSIINLLFRKVVVKQFGLEQKWKISVKML